MVSLDSPKVFIGIILLVGIGYGGWTFYQQSQSQTPQWQLGKTGAQNFPPHRVNLWSRPHPIQTGKVTFVVEYDFVDLMNSKVGTVSYKLLKPDSSSDPVSETTAKFRESGPYRDRYHGTVTVPEPGQWILEITATWKQKTSVSQFEVTANRKN